MGIKDRCYLRSKLVFAPLFFISIVFISAKCTTSGTVGENEKPEEECFVMGFSRFASEYDRNLEKSASIIVISKRDSLFLPEWLYQGQEEDSRSELHFEIMQKDAATGKYRFLEQKDMDYDYVTGGRKMVLLSKGDSIKYSEALDFLYDLSVSGFYKVQGVLTLMKSEGCSSVKTGWHEFEVK